MRLTSHLKFLAQRIFNHETIEVNSEDEEMISFLAQKNHNILECVSHISSFIKESFNYHLSDKELLYLMIHIYKIVN